MKNVVLNCGEESVFKLGDGTQISNANELSEALERMDEGIFSHHVNEQKNDFSEWAKESLKDEKLAEDLANANNKSEAQIAVLKRILELVKEVAK